MGETNLGTVLTGWTDDTGLSLEAEVIDAKTATDGEIGDRKADCLVVDDGAPSVDSTAIIEHWTDEHPTIPIVLLVDEWNDERIADALSTGAAQHLAAATHRDRPGFARRTRDCCR